MQCNGLAKAFVFIAIYWQYPTTKQVAAPLVPLMVTYVKAFLPHYD